MLPVLKSYLDILKILLDKICDGLKHQTNTIQLHGSCGKVIHRHWQDPETPYRCPFYLFWQLWSDARSWLSVPGTEKIMIYL